MAGERGKGWHRWNNVYFTGSNTAQRGLCER